MTTAPKRGKRWPSLTPSLLPRSWQLQGLASGLSVVSAYACGVMLTWIWRRIGLPEARGELHRRIWYGIAAFAAVVLPLSLWLGARRQTEIRAAVDMPGPSTATDARPLRGVRRRPARHGRQPALAADRVPAARIRSHRRHEPPALSCGHKVGARNAGAHTWTRSRERRRSVAGAILDQAERGGHDLIVLGSRRRGRVQSALLGRVRHRVVDHSPVPVLVVRPPD